MSKSPQNISGKLDGLQIGLALRLAEIASQYPEKLPRDPSAEMVAMHSQRGVNWAVQVVHRSEVAARGLIEPGMSDLAKLNDDLEAEFDATFD